MERRTEVGGTADRSGWNGGPKWVERRTEVGGTADQQGGTADWPVLIRSLFGHALTMRPPRKARPFVSLTTLRRARRVAVRSVMSVLVGPLTPPVKWVDLKLVALDGIATGGAQVLDSATEVPEEHKSHT